MLGFIISNLKKLVFMENVPGINSSEGTSNSDDVDEERNLYGYRTHPRFGGSKLIVENDVPGMITNLEESLAKGVVDGCMDFALNMCKISKGDNVIYEEDLPPIGSQVIVKRERLSRLDRWTITEMKVIYVPQYQNTIWADLDEEKDTNNHKPEKAPTLYRKEMGMVTQVCKTTAILNGELEFPLDVCDENFWIEAGDYIKIEFDKEKLEKEGVKIASRVSPLRILDFEGTISYFKTNHGFINRKISFKSRAIKTPDFHPCRDDRVYGTVIESVQSRDINFRAISVFKKSTISDASSTPQALELKPSRPLSSIELIRDVEAIGIEFRPQSLNFGQVVQGQMQTKSAILRNKSTDVALTVLSIQFDSAVNDQFKLLATSMNDRGFDESFLLEVESELELKISVNGLYPGYDEQILVIEFMNDSVKQAVGLNVSAKIIDQSELTFVGLGRGRAGLLRTPPAKGKSPGSTNSSSNSLFVMPGVKPSVVAAQAVSYVPHKLKRYAIPIDLKRRVEEKEDLVLGYLSCLNQPLAWSNYMTKLDCLVHLEEIAEEESVREFDLVGVALDRRGEHLCIEVPGLSEGRPSLITGDKVNITLHNNDQYAKNIGYEGYIHEIHRDVVLVKFHPTFHSSYNGQSVDVSFTYSRTPFRRMHQSIEHAHRLGKEILFPCRLLPQVSQCLITDPQSGRRQFSSINYESHEREDMRQLQFHNTKLNSRQQAAVVRILHGYSRPTPYVLFGPPGTGKTVTVVEAILQVYNNVPSSRILACAPSNSAADLLCLRLHESGALDPSDMARLNSYRRSTVSAMVGENVAPPKILPYCYGPDKLAEVAMHRIVVCTCVASGSLFTLGLSVGHFTHAFVDEAGQAMEPECLIPLTLVAASSGQIILAGDPLQLGPVIMSNQAEKYGLGESLLHRLISSSPVYSRRAASLGDNLGNYDPLVLTKLIHNYRSHPSLLELPSRLFYDNELLPCAAPELVDCCQNWRGLVKPELGRPLVFHGVRGQEMRDGNSPSWFNPTEAVLILKYAGMLLQDADSLGIKATDIGIITPYRKQIEKIRQLLSSGLNLSSSHHESIKIGSVEEFQGQERRVIIISTVRCDQSSSTISQNNSWMTGLNFLCKPGRFNVAVTRANALVIVVGDPYLLCRDSQWRALIRHCHSLGCYTGADLSGIADIFM